MLSNQLKYPHCARETSKKFEHMMVINLSIHHFLVFEIWTVMTEKNLLSCWFASSYRFACLFYLLSVTIDRYLAANLILV